MADDKTKSGGQDRLRINVNEEYELQDWARKFDTSRERIKEAVKAVGDLAADVEMHLKGTRATTNAEQTDRANPGGSGSR